MSLETVLWNGIGIAVFLFGTLAGIICQYGYYKTKNKLYDTISLMVMIFSGIISAYIHYRFGSRIFMYAPLSTAIVLLVVGSAVRMIWPANI